MIVQRFVLTPFQQNTRVVACDRTGMAICIDPGEASVEIVDFVASNGLTLQAIALTHGHLDHVGGTPYLKEMFPEADVIIHEADEPLYRALPAQPLAFGIQPHQLATLGFEYPEPPQPTRNWRNDEVYEVGELRFSVRHCPGHTPGHVVLAEIRDQKVFVGDCLFLGSIGRTDLPGGSYEQLITSIKERILCLDDEFVVYSGHGPETTIGNERRSNPFLTGQYDIGGRYV